MSKLPLSRVVNATINLSPAGAQSASQTDMLVCGTSDVIDTVERMRTYASLTSLAGDFGTTAEEYLAALRWFSQSPQPTQIRVGRWAKTATKGGLRCAPLTVTQQSLATWQAIIAGKFKIAVDAGVAADIGPLSFAAAANMNAVAAIISAALTGASCVWNSTYSRFEFKSNTTGATSAISYLQAPSAGVDISGNLLGRVTDSGAYVFAGIAAEPLDAMLTVMDNKFASMWKAAVAPAGVDADQQLAAAWTEASGKHVFGVTTQSAGTLLSTSTTDLAYLLQQSNYKRTCIQYSSLDAYAIMSYLGRIMTTDYSGANTTITEKFKTEPGVANEQLDLTSVTNLEAKNCNVFTLYDNDVAIVEQGVMCSGDYIDVILGTDWLATDIRTRLFNALYGANKIPQTDAGVNVLQTAIEGSCAQAVVNGLVAPGTWTSGGFGQLVSGAYLSKGYYVYSTPLALQSSADRAARKAPAFQVAAKLAGAIHSANVTININQ